MNSTKIIIGITGLYCSGKSFIEKIFIDNDFLSIDVDKIGHSVLEETKDDVIKEFGMSILNQAGNIDRKKLGAIVFSDKSKLRKLNSLVHPVMTVKIENHISATNHRYILINAALLYEMGLHKLCSKIIVVKAPLILIIYRAIKRDCYSIFKIFKILFNQNVKSFAKKNQKYVETIYIENLTADSTNRRVKQIINGIITKEIYR